MSEGEVKTIIGTCAEVVQKPGNDWVEFHIDVGSQYPVRLATKLSPLIDAAKTIGADVATWTYNEVESEKINEKSGKPYVNRYLSSVEAGAAIIENPASVNQPPIVQGQSGAVDWDSKERRDYRSRAWAQTLGAFTHTIKTDESPEDVFLRLQPFQRKVFEDVCQSFAYDDSDLPF